MTATSLTINAFAYDYVVVVLVAALIGKLRSPRALLVSVSRITGFGNGWSGFISVVLGIIEFSILTLLLCDTKISNSIGLVGLMSTMFFSGLMTIVIYLLLNDRSVPCSCFGESSRNLDWFDVFRDLTLIIASAVLFFESSHQQSWLTANIFHVSLAIMAFVVVSSIREIAAILLGNLAS